MLPGMSETEFKRLVFSVGTHKGERPLSPVEVGQLFRRALEAGAEYKDCTEQTQLSGPTMVRRFESVAGLHSDIQHLVDWGETDANSISFSSAVELSRVSEDLQPSFAVAMVQEGLTKKEAVSVRQLMERSEDDLETCIARVVGRRTIQKQVEIIMGKISDPHVRSALQQQTQHQRNVMLKKVVSRLSGIEEEYSARLGEASFAIIGPHSVSRSLASLGNPERRITDELKIELQI